MCVVVSRADGHKRGYTSAAMCNIVAAGRSIAEVDHVLANVWAQRVPKQVELRLWAGAKEILRRTGAQAPPERMVVAATLNPGTAVAHSTKRATYDAALYPMLM
jgi:hypothetical protein